MRNVEKQKEKYKSRIKRFIQNLTKIDPLWTTKRSWFEDLKNFELGDNFWSKVLVADDSSPKDKGDFYTGVFIYVNIDFQARCGNKNEQLESGFEIEPDIDNDFEKEEHESLLGYLWWLEIYKEAHKAKRFSAAEELQLQKKRRALYKSKKGEIIIAIMITELRVSLKLFLLLMLFPIPPYKLTTLHFPLSTFYFLLFVLFYRQRNMCISNDKKHEKSSNKEINQSRDHFTI